MGWLGGFIGSKSFILQCARSLIAMLSNQGPYHTGSQGQEHQSQQVKVEAASEHPLEPLCYQHFHSNDHQHQRE